jgi:hypothetical protein
MVQYRMLGRNGPRVSALGYGAMALVHGMYGSVDDEQSVATIRHALDAGITFIDTSDAYGADGHNERLVARAIVGRRDDVIVATKFGYVLDPDAPGTPVQVNWNVHPRVSGRPAFVRAAIDASLRRLNVDTIDLWYLHFPDPATPIEETVDAMAEAVQAGKARYLGLCNVSAEQIRRAHAVHPIHAPSARCCRRCASLASGLCRGHRWAAAFCRARLPVWPRTIFGRAIRAFRPKICVPTSIGLRRSARWLKRAASRLRNWRWRGCCTRATISCRFRARAIPRISTRTSRRSSCG